ncbi:MAG: hypothetical protein PF482_21880 [Desulfobacteraceae bacterium]|jgi:hypothetical protein|nr:hypothetical protein [Desulfobacteraceae bacterium]
MKRYYYSLLKLLCLAGFIVVLQTGFAFIPDMPLSGVELKEPFPGFSLQSFIQQDFQNSVSQWLSTNIGFRGYWIRMDNQINYSLFNEISEASVVLGKEKWLYGSGYINSYNRMYRMPQNVLKEKVLKIKRLQTCLMNRGVNFLFIITPSKVPIYPEYINDDYVLKHNQEKQKNYTSILPLLDKYEINYVDGHQITAELKSKSQYPVFSKSGTHWNYYTALHFTNAVIMKMQTLLGKPLVAIKDDGIELIDKPFREDADIARLANIFFPEQLFDDQYLCPQTSIQVKDKPPYKPEVLFVGGSFLWPILYYMDLHQVYSTRDMYYYFNQNYAYPRNTKTKIEKDAIKWENDIVHKDIIILEANGNILGPEIGSGFIEAALAALDIEKRRILHDYIAPNETKQNYTNGLSLFEQDDTRLWRWGVGPESKIVFYLSQASDIYLSFRFFNLIKKQRIRIEIAGDEKADYDLPTQSYISENIHFKGVSGKNTIVFKYSDWNHKNISIVKNDLRKLTIQFLELQLLSQK